MSTLEFCYMAYVISPTLHNVYLQTLDCQFVLHEKLYFVLKNLIKIQLIKYLTIRTLKINNVTNIDRAKLGKNTCLPLPFHNIRCIFSASAIIVNCEPETRNPEPRTMNALILIQFFAYSVLNK